MFQAEELHLEGGGGKGKELKEGAGEELGQALRKIKMHQLDLLEQAHLRLMLRGKPGLVGKIMEQKDRAALEKLLRQEARRAKLPVQEEESSRPRSTSRSAAPSVREGKGKGTSSAGEDRRARERSKSRVRFEAHVAPPRLVQEDWPITVQTELTAGDQAVAVVPDAADLEAMVRRMKGTQGPAALVSMRAHPHWDRQSQVLVNLVSYSQGGPSVHAAPVWLIQVGTEEVKPLEVPKELTIQKRAPSSIVTGVAVWKSLADKELISNLEAKRTAGLREHLLHLLG